MFSQCRVLKYYTVDEENLSVCPFVIHRAKATEQILIKLGIVI